MSEHRALTADEDRDFETGLTKADLAELRAWLRMLTCTNLIARSIRQKLREEFDMTLPRFDLMAQLHRAPEGVTMGELSRRLMVTNGNVTGMIERLVGEGLVERQPAPSDRRAQLVRLTPAGEAALASILPTHHAWVEHIFAGLEEEELATLLRLLGKLKRGALDAAEPVTDHE